MKTKMYKKIIFAVVLIIAIFLAVNFLILPNEARAQEAANELAWGGKQGIIGSAIGLGDEDPRIIAAKIIRVFLGFLGIIAFGLIVYAGWLWMTSEGNEEKIEQSKKILKNAAVGLLIILASFGIVSFIINKLYGATGGPGAGGGPPGQGGGLVALGSGIIESHYPARNQQDVPRNTKIVITFKEPMDRPTIILDSNNSGSLGDWVDSNSNNIIEEGEYDKIKSDNIKIYKTADGIISGQFATGLYVAVTTDSKTFVFKQIGGYIGSPSEKIWYTTALSKDIKKADGNAAFPGAVGDIGYDWSFEVSTIIDVTPPKIVEVIPIPATTEPRNVVVQINFNEAVDPISSSGQTANGFNNIIIKNNTNNGTMVEGNFYISNQYKTVEFLTEDECGVNSCGEKIYCLPANSSLSSLAKAATLMIAGEPVALIQSGGNLYDGIVDMADNSLDGNSNDAAQGPQNPTSPGFGSGQPPYNANSPVPADQGDDYEWTFNTNNTIDITPPVISSISPGINAFDIALNTVPEATFSKLLMSSSINTSNVGIISDPAINYWTEKTNNISLKQTTAKINHDLFNDNADYKPRFTSGIKDAYQNCYTPCSGLGVSGNPSCCNGAPNTGTSCP
jgi:uncharacterized SAM-binding protein YcdF (DUF218 family)